MRAVASSMGRMVRPPLPQTSVPTAPTRAAPSERNQGPPQAQFSSASQTCETLVHRECLRNAKGSYLNVSHPGVPTFRCYFTSGILTTSVCSNTLPTSLYVLIEIVTLRLPLSIRLHRLYVPELAHDTFRLLLQARRGRPHIGRARPLFRCLFSRTCLAIVHAAVESKALIPCVSIRTKS